MTPVIRYEKYMTKTDWILEVIGIVGVLLICFLVIYFYNRLPNVIPVHFALNGQPNGFTTKSMLWMFPAISLVFYVVLSLQIRSHYFLNAALLMRILKVIITLVFLYVTFVAIQVGLGEMKGLGQWFLTTMLLIIISTVVIFLMKGYKWK